MCVCAGGHIVQPTGFVVFSTTRILNCFDPELEFHDDMYEPSGDHRDDTLSLMQPQMDLAIKDWSLFSTKSAKIWLVGCWWENLFRLGEPEFALFQDNFIPLKRIPQVHSDIKRLMSEISFEINLPSKSFKYHSILVYYVNISATLISSWILGVF